MWWLAFFHSRVDCSWLGMAQKWSILDQKWPNMAGLSTLQSGPKGSERDQNGQPKCFSLLGTLLGPPGPFGTISNKNWYFAPKHLCQILLRPFGAKESFGEAQWKKTPCTYDLIRIHLRVLQASHQLCKLSKRSVLSTFPRSSKIFKLWLFSFAISIIWWIIFFSNTRTMK